MSLSVFLAVMTAAILHASWNALVKYTDDKHLSMAAIVLGHVPFALIALVFSPAPNAEAWPFLIVGAGLHVGYQIFLSHSYRFGDLTQVYPIARGVAPLVVAALSVAFLDVDLSMAESSAILLIGLGIMSLVLVRQGEGGLNLRAVFLALITGLFVAGYSIVDGLGARAAGAAIGFYAWLSIVNAVIFGAYVYIHQPQILKRIPAEGKRVAVFGGGMSFLAYSLVIWSFTHAPIALVTALRETSIIFALLIGAFLLKEKIELRKLVSTMITLVGAVLLRFSR